MVGRLKIWCTIRLSYNTNDYTKGATMGNKFKDPTVEDLEMYFNPSWTHYVASVKPPRPGFGLFAATLEHQFFPPDTPENVNFNILATGWLNNTLWMTVSIPTEKKHLAEAVANYAGLKILETIPIACVKYPAFATVKREAYEQLKDVNPKWEAFPLHKAINLFSLENSDEHPIRSEKMSMDEWMKYELSVVSKIIGEHEWTDEDEKEMKRFRQILDV